MDPLYSKAQRKMEGSSSKATSKGSARKAKKKKRSPKTQNAGQPSGPGVSTSERSQSRSAVDRGEETTQGSGGESSAMGSKVASYAVGALHAIDIGLGLALLIYGGMVNVVQVTALAISYGLVLFLGAVGGAIGYYSGACNRRGLWASAIAGIVTCILDIAAFIAIFAGWDSFIQFLNDNDDALMLSEGSINTINGMKILFAVIFIVLAGFEGHRSMVMWGMKDTMSAGGSRMDWFLSLFGLAKRKKTDDFVVFDDNASLESSLLWSKDGAQPTSEDYLEFVPEHERGLEDFSSKVSMPTPPEDRVDY
ncbi:hypothetical protein ACHAXR_001455 [Thalassiosira sp. AJA248-18]